MSIDRNGTMATLGRLASAVAALAGSVTGAHAQDVQALVLDVPTQVSGGEAVCTGAGLEAREDPRWNAYPLKIEVAARGGQYLGGVQVTLARDGKTVLAVSCAGPWVLFKLPAAHYRIEAVVDGKTVSSAADVPASGQRQVMMRFAEIAGAPQ